MQLLRMAKLLLVDGNAASKDGNSASGGAIAATTLAPKIGIPEINRYNQQIQSNNLEG